MKKKQAWKVMGAVLAGTLVFSDAVPLRASASAGTEKSAVQNETVSGTENGTETKRAAVYVNLKTGDDTADGTTAETAVKTVEKAQELLAVAAAELQADGKTTEKNTAADTSKTAAEEAAEKYLVFVGMDEKELETYRKKQQKTDFRGRVTDTVFAADEIVVTEAGYEAVLAAEKAKETVSETPTLAPGESPAPDAAEDTVTPTPGPTETPDAEPTAEPTVTPDAEPTETPDAEPTVTPAEEPTATPTPDADNGEDTGDTPTAAPTPDAEPTVTPEVTPTTAPGENTDDSENPENPETPAEDPTVTPAPDDTAKDDPAADDTNQDDTNQDNQNGTGNDASSDQWKQDENLDDLVKDEIQKENETVKNFDEISNPSGTDSTEDGYLISNVSLLIQPVAVSLSRSLVSEEQTETAEAETADEGEHELLAAAEQKSNLSAGEMTASAADDVSTLRAAGTILVGPDNYGTNKTSTPTPTARVGIRAKLFQKAQHRDLRCFGDAFGFGEHLVILFVGEIHAFGIALPVHHDAEREDINAVFFFQLAWDVAGGIRQNSCFTHLFTSIHIHAGARCRADPQNHAGVGPRIRPQPPCLTNSGCARPGSSEGARRLPGFLPIMLRAGPRLRARIQGTRRRDRRRLCSAAVPLW